MFARCGSGRVHLLAVVCFSSALVGGAWVGAAEKTAPAVDGRELFTREWIPKDPRSHGGDGLGPVFNDTSCVACHNQGGLGGAGPAAKNVHIVSAFSNTAHGEMQAGPSLLGSVFFGIFGGPSPPPKLRPLTPEQREAAIKSEREQVAKIHPGFRTARSVVLHRFSTEPDYTDFRSKLTGLSQFGDFSFLPGGQALDQAKDLEPLPPEVQREVNHAKVEAQFVTAAGALNGGAQVDGFTFLLSTRNTVPLFGSGQIDAIPEAVLRTAAQRKFEDFPEVSGRPAKLKDGRLGRFGWKAQKANLNDFVLTACAVELGLHVPGESQSGLPQKPEYKAPGMDLNEEECNALVSFIAKLPSPRERKPASKVEGEYLQGGRETFETVGCAACHTPRLGDVAGIHSDLLLHDMGPELGDSGSYNGFAPNSTEEEELKQPLPPLVQLGGEPAKPIDETNLVGATRREWRTPPLWGLRDSAPYLHDGRAATIEQAVAMHGGEATRSTHKFFKLPAAERLQLTLFLRSLTAPE